jgi:hypothetical protein
MVVTVAPKTEMPSTQATTDSISKGKNPDR